MGGWMENFPSPRFSATVSNRSHLPQDRSLKVMLNLHESFPFSFLSDSSHAGARGEQSRPIQLLQILG